MNILQNVSSGLDLLKHAKTKHIFILWNISFSISLISCEMTFNAIKFFLEKHIKFRRIKNVDSPTIKTKTEIKPFGMTNLEFLFWAVKISWWRHVWVCSRKNAQHHAVIINHIWFWAFGGKCFTAVAAKFQNCAAMAKM